MGKKHARGRYLWVDGSVYEGDWEDNYISGDVNFNFKFQIILKRENIYGLTEDHMMDNGKIIKCMEKGYIFGEMVEDMKVIT